MLRALRRVLPTLSLLLALVPAATSARADERRPFHDAVDGVRLAAEDFGLAATSPLRMDRSDWITLGQVLAVGGVLFAFDEDLDRMAQRNLDEPFVEQTHEIGDTFDRFGLMGKTWPYYGGAMLIGYATEIGWLKRMGGEILVAQWMSGALRNGFKIVLGRRRPNEGRGAYWFEFNGGTSLPSGHSASMFSAVEVIRLHADRWWVTVPLYTAAVSLALQRVYSRQHWASDSWIGAVSGIAAARFVYRRHEPGATSPEGWSLGPAISPLGTASVALRRGF